MFNINPYISCVVLSILLALPAIVAFVGAICLIIDFEALGEDEKNNQNRFEVSFTIIKRSTG